MKYKLSLDYDRISEFSLEEELKRLSLRFPKKNFKVFESSENSYHIRLLDPIDWDEAIEIMNFSRCSLDYKHFCKKVKAFPIRLSRKFFLKEDCTIIKPVPVLI